jgi:hypothetical protein
MVDYLSGLHATLALATNSDSPLLVAYEILVGNGGFSGPTHAECGYILDNVKGPLNGYWETIPLGTAWLLTKLKLGIHRNPKMPGGDFKRIELIILEC